MGHSRRYNWTIDSTDKMINEFTEDSKKKLAELNK